MVEGVLLAVEHVDAEDDDDEEQSDGWVQVEVAEVAVVCSLSQHTEQQQVSVSTSSALSQHVSEEQQSVSTC